MVARKHPDGAAASLQAYFAADLIMRAPTGVLLAKVGEFRTMFGVYVLGVCLSIAIAYAEDLNLLVALSAALGAMSAASIVAFNAVAPVVVGYEHATQLLGISYTVVWTLPALTVMPIISLAHPVDLDYKWTFVTCGICSLCAAACTGMSWFYSNRRGSQIHPQVALDAWVLVPVPIVDDMHITDRRYSEIVDEE
jgi:MFS family permease